MWSPVGGGKNKRGRKRVRGSPVKKRKGVGLTWSIEGENALLAVGSPGSALNPFSNIGFDITTKNLDLIKGKREGQERGKKVLKVTDRNARPGLFLQGGS